MKQNGKQVNSFTVIAQYFNFNVMWFTILSSADKINKTFDDHEHMISIG